MKPKKALMLLLFFLISLAAFVTFKQHLCLTNKIYYVRVINGFTNNSSLPLVVWCEAPDGGGNIGGRALQERDDYSWFVQVGLLWSSTRFDCTMKWDGKRKKFEAFRASRDRYRCGERGLCIWLVKEDGFYFSGDGINWIRDFPWMP